MADVTAPFYWKEGSKGLAGRALSNRSGMAIATLALSILLLFALGILITANLATLRERFAWTQHTEEVVLQVGALQRNILRMETKLRAYALTTDRRHISDWGIIATETRQGLARLEGLVSDNPGQTRHLSVIRPRIEERIGRWSRIVDLGLKNGSTTVTQDIRDELARDVVDRPMRNISTGLADFRAVERGLLRERQAQAERQTVLLTYLSIMIILTAPIFGTIGIVLLLRDQNRLRNRELHLQLEHSQRLNLMGETASTLAHELKQPLTSANNYLAVLKKTFEKSGAEHESNVAQKMGDQLARANGIIQRLRNFIENRHVERLPESPASLVEDAVSLLGILDTRYRLGTELEPGLPSIAVDRVQIQQVLVNLMRNAIEAMEEHGTVRGSVVLEAKPADGGFIEISVSDTGPGFPPQMMDNAFLPLSSAKAEGLGIGLALCRSIVEAHGGRLALDNDPRGAVVRFTLPIAKANSQ